MLSFVPPVFALTLLLSIGLVVARTGAETDVSHELARDLLRHHEHAYDVASGAGFPIGPIEDPLPYPLEPLASWRSEVALLDGQRYMLTWADGYGADGFAPSAYRGVVSELPDRIGLSGVVGVVVFPGAGSAQIGDREVPETISPIPAGTPAILRRVR